MRNLQAIINEIKDAIRKEDGAEILISDTEYLSLSCEYGTDEDEGTTTFNFEHHKCNDVTTISVSGWDGITNSELEDMVKFILDSIGVKPIIATFLTTEAVTLEELKEKIDTMGHIIYRSLTDPKKVIELSGLNGSTHYVEVRIGDDTIPLGRFGSEESIKLLSFFMEDPYFYRYYNLQDQNKF